MSDLSNGLAARIEILEEKAGKIPNLPLMARAPAALSMMKEIFVVLRVMALRVEAMDGQAHE